MSKVLYSRLTPSSNENARRVREHLISNDEEKDELLVDEKPFEPPIPPKVIRMQQVNSFFTNCWKKPSHHISEKYLNDLDKRLVEKERPRIFFLLATFGIVITLSYLRDANSLMYDQLQTSYHSAMPSKMTTEVDSKMRNFLNTSISDVKALGFPLPVELQHLGEISLPLQQGDIPFFFHIPRSGGSTAKYLVGECLGIVVASETGAGHDGEPLTLFASPWGTRFPNVDTTTIAGINRANQLHLVQSGIVGMVYSPHLYAGASLFNQAQTGRMFTMLRHPVDRLVSLYFSETHKKGSSSPTMSLNKWVQSQNVKDNWVTRHLTNKIDGPLTSVDVEAAKEILRRKCLIGLLDSKDESIRRFSAFFKFQFNSDKAVECQDKILHWGWKNTHHTTLSKDSPHYQMLEEMNAFDMEIYYFSQKLFIHQANLFYN